jgi:ATP-dependent Clp protease protease subunit
VKKRARRGGNILPFYNFVYGADGANITDELYIDGEIARDASWWGTSGLVIARQFRRELAKCRDVTVWINSPGGDVFAGAEIYTALREHRGKVTVKVMGIAASAASVIAMAGDEVLMSPVAYMMIHDPWTFAMGNAREMEHWADVLRELGEGLITAYVEKSGKSRDEIVELLATETYMSAQTCVDEGFADGLMEFGSSEGTGDSGQGGNAAWGSSGMPRAASPTMMRFNRYGQAAVCAMVKGDGFHTEAQREIDLIRDTARRAEIVARAQMIADIYSV